MNRLFLPALAAFCVLAPLSAQTTDPALDYSLNNGSFWNMGIYQQRSVAEANLADSARLDQLIRGGSLYLSLADALALALENNLDIAVARFSPKEAETDLLRAKAGANLSGVQTQISTLSTASSASGGGGGGGFTSAPNGQATGVNQGASAQIDSGGQAGSAASFFGTQTINLDPQLSATFGLFHTSIPQITSSVTGTNTLVSNSATSSVNFQQGFITGTTLGARYSTFRQKNNNIRNNFNPTLSSDLTVSLTQRLTQGFGRAINNRNIRIAKNNQTVEDLNFRDQVITTVSRVEQLYWDLVTFRRIAEARRLDVELAGRLLTQTRKQAELGLQARIEVTRSEAESTTYRQQMVEAERAVHEQEEILKNALSKHGPTSSTLAGVSVVPVDSIVVPAQEALAPVQDLVVEALRERVSLERSRINLENSDINLRGIKNALKPSLDLTAFATNNALAGTINSDVVPLPGAETPDEFFIGGLGTAWGQIARRNFPDYGIQFQLNIPLKNRQAQADMTRESLRRRRSDIQLRQQENAVRLEVARALANLTQARETYAISAEARELRQQMVEAEEKRFGLGQSTIFQIIQTQRDLSGARTTEINSLSSYEAARNEFERVLGRTLQANNVSIDEAYTGQVSKAPDPIPPAAVVQ
ncbi:MAG: TolC family protein [Acidobacteria bacterium]|nr:TolC family protein [Acidobacteriota bacterium]MDA1236419.1 TolC family protein [Acidobacteriota bacterium]